jgi:hypothetical protein
MTDGHDHRAGMSPSLRRECHCGRPWRCPIRPQGLIRFAHGSGSSGFSARNRRMAGSLNENKPATLLLEPLTAKEQRVDEGTREFRFDIGRRADRLMGSIFPWACLAPAPARLPPSREQSNVPIKCGRRYPEADVQTWHKTPEQSQRIDAAHPRAGWTVGRWWSIGKPANF